jgi:two-component system sensor histidine kinase RegB
MALTEAPERVNRRVMATPLASRDFSDHWASTSNPLSLRVLVRLRWVAVIGQSLAILGVYFLLGFDLPLGLSLLAISLSAWLNLFLTFRWPAGRRLSSTQAGLMLGYDIVQLGALLYLTGGLENPFSFLFLVPVTVSATSLPLRWTLALGALAFGWASLLAVWHLPLPWGSGGPLALPRIYIAGLWAAIICGVIFSAIYARRIAQETRVMSSALAATEMVLAREQRLSALDGLAAAAAHELGTPLATIALVAKELKRELPANTPHKEDIDLLISQAARCREILSRLANRDQQVDTVYGQVRLTAMLEDLVAPLRGSDIHIAVEAAGERDVAEPVFQRNPAISYGLSNLLENAADFAAKAVIVQAGWSSSAITVIIRDDGPGFTQAVFDRLGEPFVTTRQGYDTPEMSEDGGHQGMGLGLFIAKTLLERSGATVTLNNRASPAQGAEVVIGWARGSVEPPAG